MNRATYSKRHFGSSHFSSDVPSKDIEHHLLGYHRGHPTPLTLHPNHLTTPSWQALNRAQSLQSFIKKSCQTISHMKEREALLSAEMMWEEEKIPSICFSLVPIANDM